MRASGPIGRLLLIALLLLPARARAAEKWSAPDLVFETSGTVSAPQLVADSAGGVHLFFAFAEPPEPEAPVTNALAYAYRGQQGWSAPVTVLIASRGTQLRDPAIALDDRGWLHVVWKGADHQIEYSRAHLTEAANWARWTAPRVLSKRSSFHAHVLSTRDGNLHFVYARQSGDVCYRRSADGGVSWSEERAISAVDAGNEAIDHPRLESDPEGRIHLVWSLFGPPPNWPPAGVYYQRSEDGGTTWSPALPIATERNSEIAVAATGADEVHLVWYGSHRTGRRMHRWSGNGGETWSPPGELDRRMRSTWSGMPALAADGAGSLHLVNLSDARLFHLVWSAGLWSNPTLEPPVESPPDAGFALIAISEGNRLHLTFTSDRTKIWYASTRTDAKSVPPHPIPTRAPPGVLERLTSFSGPFLILMGLLAVFALEPFLRRARRRH